MKRTVMAIGFGLLAGTGVLAQSEQTKQPSNPAPQGTTGTSGTSAAAVATVNLADAKGQNVGTATLQQTPHGVLVSVDLKNVMPGVHAIHIHETGRCEAPSFETAGGHFDPKKREHGFLDATGAHAGDMPNIEVPSNKQLSVEHLIRDVTLEPGPASLLDQDGSAIVIHAGKDDYTSEPAGNSGDRIACGQVRR